MYAKYAIAVAFATLILVSSSIPVYASHIKKVEPAEEEKVLFDKIVARLEKHKDMMPIKVEDVKKSFSEPITVFFSCNQFSDSVIDSVSVSVRTQFANFDADLAERHRTGILSGLYIWDCKAIKDRYTLTIECVNTLMLNPDFLSKEETETNERKVIAMAENEMVLYHEFLHGELMIDAMKDTNDSSGWRNDACTFFESNNNELDYEPSDGDHKVISRLELDYLAKLIKNNDGKLIIETVKKEEVGSDEFKQVVATFDELGELGKKGFFVFAKAINMKDVKIIVSAQEETLSISGSLQDPSLDGVARIFVMPKTTSSNIKIDLTVDDTAKNIEAEFTFTARVKNLQSNDITGTLRLGIDGKIVNSKDIDVPASKEKSITFVWKSNDQRASKHVAAIDGFNTASNEITLFTFDRVESITASCNGKVTDQIIIDPDTNERISVAKPNRITAVVMDKDVEIQLIAPDGTIVIGKNAIVNEVGARAHIITVEDQTLVVKYTDLNERIRFFSIKSTLRDTPLPSGEWSIKALDSNGNDADTRFKYYVTYVGSEI